MTMASPPRQRAILYDVLAPFAAGFDRVGLFGSRATGRASPQSDVDLVIYGADDPRLVDRLFTLFDESLLPVTVDVVDYDRTTIRRSRSTSTRSFGSCSSAAI